MGPSTFTSINLPLLLKYQFPEPGFRQRVKQECIKRCAGLSGEPYREMYLGLAQVIRLKSAILRTISRSRAMARCAAKYRRFHRRSCHAPRHGQKRSFRIVLGPYLRDSFANEDNLRTTHSRSIIPMLSFRNAILRKHGSCLFAR
jgi:hypothetical protein